ncbi:MAG: hypothetical protein MOGMAGMI_00036 [Candidatus Omnitrophica bacterium]|nr:hypothetical protein [Candidatus Omnitrophota bacterium]
MTLSELSRAKAPLSVALVCALAAYAAAALSGLKAHTDPSEMDTVPYLDAALEVRKLGGLAGFIPACIEGRYTEGTRHPLYLMALSTVARQDIRAFVDAKVLTAWMGAVMLLAALWTVSRLFGGGPAVAAGALLLVNATFIHQSTMVACETLLTVWVLLWWWAASAAFERPKLWVLAGLFSGLAYLTKSLGLFTVIAVLMTVAALSVARRRAYWKSRYFAAYFAVFLLVVSPLLARNLKLYGQAFYNDSNSVLWIDRWHDYYKVGDAAERPTLGTYLRDHTPAEIARTLWDGLTFRNVRMTVDGLKPLPFWSRFDGRILRGYHEATVPWQGVWALLVLALMGLGVWLTRRREATALVIASAVFLVPFVAWFSKIFPGNPPTRILHPLLVLGLGLAAVPLGRALAGLGWQRLLRGASVAALVYALAIGFLQDWKGFELKRSYEFSKFFLIQLRTLERYARPGEVVLAGPTLTSNYFYFEPAIGARVELWPKVSSDEQMRQVVRDTGATLGVLDLATVVYNMAYYGKYFDAGPSIGLRQRSPLPDYFHKLNEEPEIPHYECYRFQGA